MTNWGKWLESHPRTQVLSRSTGFNRNYDRPSYVQYRNSEKLMFDVSQTSDKLPLKSWVLGVEINGKAKAYPFSELARSASRLNDSFQGINLEIEYDKRSKTAYVEIDESLGAKVQTLYWFAWYAFHPGTEIYKQMEEIKG